MNVLFDIEAEKSVAPEYTPTFLNENIHSGKQINAEASSTMTIEFSGDSMINAFIPPNATLLVDCTLTPHNGDIVLATINGIYTVKFLKKNLYKSWLVPANSKYRECEITPAINVQICGVVTAVIVDPKNLKKCML